MAADNFTNWLKFTPASQVGYRRAYVELPVFSYAVTNQTPSICVAQFNFSASSNFVLANRPTKPSGVNYGLCIRYRVGETVYRYKLWTDNNFVLNDAAAPLYTGQLIKKNFVLEIWSFVGQTTAVQATAIRMISSVRSIPTDLTVATDYALATGAEFTQLNNIAPSLPFSPAHRWSLVDSSWYPWTDSIGGVQLLATANAPLYVAPDSTWFKGSLLFASGSDRTLQGTIPSKAWTNCTFYIVAALNTAPGFQRTLFELTNYIAARMGNVDKVRIAGWNTGFSDFTIADTLPHIFAFSIVDLGSSQSGLTLQIDDTFVGGALIDPPRITAALPVIVSGIYSGSHLGTINLAEIMVFSQLIPFGSADDIAIKQYLSNYHFGAIPLPLTFHANVAWLDNP